MICTHCQVWEVTGEDNFCAWCGAQLISIQARLEPTDVPSGNYLPPVHLVVANTSSTATVEIARILSGAPWVSLLASEALPRTVRPGEQETFLLDVDPFSAGSVSTASIEVQPAFGSSVNTVLRLTHGEKPRLAASDLPYATWQLAPGQHLLETPHSTSFRVIDSASGRAYRIRRYRSDTPPSPALLKSFLDVAKSLRNVSLASEWVWFAYTLDGRCFTVGNDIPGRPLDQVIMPGRLSRTEARHWLRAVLAALCELHAQAGSRGPLYHGALEPQHLFVPQEDAAAGSLLLTSGMYLEHVLTESPYSPEYFLESDLRRAGLAVLSLIAHADSARATPQAQAAMLDEVNDVAVGGTLDFLVRPAASGPVSAQQALDLFDTLVRAERENHRAEFQKAYALSGSSRLLPVLARLGELETTVEQARRHAAEAAQRVASAAIPPPPKPPPYTPVPPPKPPSAPRPTVYALWSSRARRASAFIVQWIKILTATVLLLLAIGAAILVYRFGSWLQESKPSARSEAPSFSVTATPNPVQRGQRATLNWTTRGYDRVLLDGNPVGANGFRLIYPNASVIYHFEGFTPKGTRKIADLRVTVINRRPKPKAGVPSETPAQAAIPPD